MENSIGFDRCLAFIQCQLSPPEQGIAQHHGYRPRREPRKIRELKRLDRLCQKIEALIDE